MRTAGILVLSLALAGACGSSPITPELRTARDTVDQARSGPAAELAPGRVRRAERTLAAAERAPDGSRIERDLAYVADRQARLAMVEADLAAARLALAERQRASGSELEGAAVESDRPLAAEERRAALEGELDAVRRELESVRGELESIRTEGRRERELTQRERELEAREHRIAARLEADRRRGTDLAESRAELRSVRDELARVRDELAAHRERLDEAAHGLEARERELADRERALAEAVRAQAEAEGRARAAVARLEELASVERTSEGLVVTLSGDLLFEHDQAELRPLARPRLRAVAEVLRSLPDVQAVIDSHADARSHGSHDRQLAQRRAEAVRQFLVDEGIAMRRLRTVERAGAEPIGSPEGGRRVEIHLRSADGALTGALAARPAARERSIRAPAGGAGSGGSSAPFRPAARPPRLP